MKYLYTHPMRGHFFELELTISHKTNGRYIMIHSQPLPVRIGSKDRGSGMREGFGWPTGPGRHITADKIIDNFS